VTPVVDFALASSKKDRENRSAICNIDPNRIVLMGISLGGYLAARAAAFEDRLSACVLNDGVFDLHEAFLGKIVPPLMMVQTQI
jgi:acetyl esterase/lipase